MELTSKQRAYLRSLGQKLEPIVWVGKGDISPAVVQSTDEALTSRELVKGRVQQEAPLTAREAGTVLAEACQATLVATIGRTFLLYRPNPEKPHIILEE
ncbi:MAG TPA: YhbY family RNA-binding protein [Bacillota bacterium]|nr:YhbY family RNA-binding protein [Bacillota bacterium]